MGGGGGVLSYKNDIFYLAIIYLFWLDIKSFPPCFFGMSYNAGLSERFEVGGFIVEVDDY